MLNATKNKNIYTFLLPNLLDIQRTSYCWFLEKGLVQELGNFSAIKSYSGELELNFATKFYTIKPPRYKLAETKRRDSTYSVRIFIHATLKCSGENRPHEKLVFLGDIPLMTNNGTFIVNGIERVIINQIVRSPGIYYKSEVDKNGSRVYLASLISNRGSWIKFEMDKDEIIYVKIDKAKKFPVYFLLRALGLENETIVKYLDGKSFRVPSFADVHLTTEECLLKVYNKLRPDESATAKGCQQLLYSRFFDNKRYDLGYVGRHKLNQRLNLDVNRNIRILTSRDILGIANCLINFRKVTTASDDIDHLGNRRVRSIGELLSNQIRVGLGRLERIVRERMTICEPSQLRVNTLMNPKPLAASIREFFGSNPLSQFMDQTNPLAEITHKRRLSVLGPGGIARDRAGFLIRDIHPSQYGRICPIETPEGPNAGLIGSLAAYGKVNSYGFIETPFYKVRNGRVLKEAAPIYLQAIMESNFRLAAGDIGLDENNFIRNQFVSVRYRNELLTVETKTVDYMAVSPLQVVSLATSLIPFLEHDDANRALMGSNMQRQSVPLLYAEAPLVGTGLEAQTARDSGMVVLSLTTGKVVDSSEGKIRVTDKRGNMLTYPLTKYQRSNQDTCINQKPLVSTNEKIAKGQIIADGTSTEGGELAVGQNILIAYMPWEGYNYEDAFVINERLVYDDLHTSIHIEKFEIEARQTKLGPEEITRDLPNLSEHSVSKLDENGIINVGSWVESGDVLVGKLTPKGESDYLPEGKLLRAIFGEKSRDVRNTSLKLHHGTYGRVLDVKIFSRANQDDLPPGTNEIIKIYIAQIRKVHIGDKMAGRHGNKGIISKILPRQDMPYLPDGTPIDILLNPLGVPSRMNVGQIFEALLGLAAEHLSARFKVIPFDEMNGPEASRGLVHNKLKEAATSKPWLFSKQHPGKIILTDGRTGEKYDNPITVGRAYILKLVHLVDDKIHARSTGPYSLVTQQPLGGRAQQGGQRLGEMEVWALEAFGAAYTLQELLTIKSDDMQGRNEALNAIVKGYPIPRPGIPESFKVLLRELQALCLDIAAYQTAKNKNIDNEINLMAESYDALENRLSTPDFVELGSR
uniref:RNA polymerase beta subunit n=1 Tax=Ochrosphaera neapolitana TaxID=35137 RepID=UPI00286A0A10|nr:RNA polymerase beta subunit [Ochrosphaera neapolitana]WKK50099.1 RNA polymerase beta subunit [Ochrosphaera neapolitana]